MMLRINKKSIISIVIVLSIIYVGLFMDGCMGLNSRESFTQKVLKKKYGEDFIVHEIDSRGPTDWQATVSPKNIPECLFYVYVDSDGNVDSSYCNAYTAYLMTGILKEDLKLFFPSAYIRMELHEPIDENIDFRNLPLEKIIEKSNQTYPESSPEWAYWGALDIYLDSGVGSNKQYEEEYLYFTDKINEYVTENRMVPLSVSYHLVDRETMDRIKNYYMNDLDYDSYFQNKVRGNVPEMSACFISTMPGFVSKEEYVNRRRNFENAR